jgi:hypothetical protein
MKQQLAHSTEGEQPSQIVTRGADRDTPWLARHWLFPLNLAMGTFVAGTLLAPLLMRLGLDGPARLVYTLYSFVCHQLPERSYILFGPNGVNTYSRAQVIAWGADPAYLRGFVGNAQVGFKRGIAERDTAIYGTFFLCRVGLCLRQAASSRAVLARVCAADPAHGLGRRQPRGERGHADGLSGI